MNFNKSTLIDENSLSDLGPSALKLIEAKGAQLENEILSKLSELEKMVMEGSSSDELVTVTINGNHQLLDLVVHHPLNDWAGDQTQISQLISEAINDGMYKVDLIIEKEISIIKYKYLKQVLDRLPILENKLT